MCGAISYFFRINPRPLPLSTQRQVLPVNSPYLDAQSLKRAFPGARLHSNAQRLRVTSPRPALMGRQYLPSAGH